MIRIRCNRLFLPVVILLFTAVVFPALNPARARTLVDNAGRTIIVPDTVRRIACLPGPSYEMVFMLGGKDQICQVRKDHKTAYPLANLTNPDLKNYSSSLSNINPKARINIEEFIRIAPDVVIYYNVPHALKKFEEARIPVYVYQPSSQTRNMDILVSEEKRSMRSLAALIGGNAPAKAEKWCRYYDQKLEILTARTRNIPEKDRPGMYIGNSWGTNPLATWSKNSLIFAAELCGGINVTREIKGDRFPEINLEQLIAWNPDVIIMDNHGREPDRLIREIYANDNWRAINAVRNKRIHRIPSGVFFLDKGTSRPVYLLWLARQLHPDRFEDIDMVMEMQTYFREFYDYDLSVEEAERALQGWDLLKG